MYPMTTPQHRVQDEIMETRSRVSTSPDETFSITTKSSPILSSHNNASFGLLITPKWTQMEMIYKHSPIEAELKEIRMIKRQNYLQGREVKMTVNNDVGLYVMHTEEINRIL